MRSWDKFMLALPLGKIVYKVAGPLFNPTQQELERKMIEITHEADGSV
jgi:lysophospholipid acyltransferase (LPLAT)-like uncharacterized protein